MEFDDKSRFKYIAQLSSAINKLYAKTSYDVRIKRFSKSITHLSCCEERWLKLNSKNIEEDILMAQELLLN